MNNEQRVLDEIDALVDEQMANYGNRSGYDHNVNQDMCEWCGEDWHALPITKGLQWARMHYRMTLEMPADYDYSTDETEVVCDGADFIGPRISDAGRRMCKKHAETRRDVAQMLADPAHVRDQLDGSHIGPLPKWLTIPAPKSVGQWDWVDQVIDSTRDQLVDQILRVLNIPPLVMFPNPLLPAEIAFDDLYTRFRDPGRQGRFEAFAADQEPWRMPNPNREVTIADGAPWIVGEHFRLDEGSRVGYQGLDGEIHYGRIESHEPSGNGSWTVTIGGDDDETDNPLPGFMCDTYLLDDLYPEFVRWEERWIRRLLNYVPRWLIP